MTTIATEAMATIVAEVMATIARVDHLSNVPGREEIDGYEPVGTSKCWLGRPGSGERRK